MVTGVGHRARDSPAGAQGRPDAGGDRAGRHRHGVGTGGEARSSVPRHAVVALVEVAGGRRATRGPQGVEAHVVGAGGETVDGVGAVGAGGEVTAADLGPVTVEHLDSDAGQRMAPGVGDRARDRPARDQGGVDPRPGGAGRDRHTRGPGGGNAAAAPCHVVVALVAVAGGRRATRGHRGVEAHVVGTGGEAGDRVGAVGPGLGAGAHRGVTGTVDVDLDTPERMVRPVGDRTGDGASDGQGGVDPRSGGAGRDRHRRGPGGVEPVTVPGHPVPALVEVAGGRRSAGGRRGVEAHVVRTGMQAGDRVGPVGGGGARGLEHTGLEDVHGHVVDPVVGGVRHRAGDRPAGGQGGVDPRGGGAGRDRHRRRPGDVAVHAVPGHAVVALVRVVDGRGVEAHVDAPGGQAADGVGPVGPRGGTAQRRPRGADDLDDHAGDAGGPRHGDRTRDSTGLGQPRVDPRGRRAAHHVHRGGSGDVTRDAVPGRSVPALVGIAGGRGAAGGRRGVEAHVGGTGRQAGEVVRSVGRRGGRALGRALGVGRDDHPGQPVGRGVLHGPRDRAGRPRGPRARTVAGVEDARRGERGVQATGGEEVARDVGDQLDRAQGAVVQVDVAVGTHRGDDQVGHGLAGREVEVGGQRSGDPVGKDGEVAVGRRLGRRHVEHHGRDPAGRDAAGTLGLYHDVRLGPDGARWSVGTWCDGGGRGPVGPPG